MKKEEDQIMHAMNDDGLEAYKWIAFMDRLSDGDILKHEEIYKKNYVETLNLLSYWKLRDKAQEMANKTK